MSADLVLRFVQSIASGSVRVVDLSQTLMPSTPVGVIPPHEACNISSSTCSTDRGAIPSAARPGIPGAVTLSVRMRTT
jgi:hypothetical protein